MTPATLELIWDAPDDVTLYAETPCGQGQLSESSPGRKVYTFPGSVAGKYFFRIFYYGCSVFGQPAAPPANITGTLTLGSDTPIVFHGTVQPRTYCMGAPNWFEFTYVHTTPYVSLSDFYLVPDKSFITTAQGTGFSYSAYGGCISTRWYPERDPITLTIVSGSEFGKFAVGDNPALVTTVTLLVSELPNVRFIPSGRFAPDGVVTIEVRCLSLVSACELQVRYCSILLGETKYFYEVEGGGSETRPWMKIYEAVSPELPSGAQVDGVWTVRESGAEPNQGQRLGVYWEQEKPIPNGSGTLPVGMVRVVGRYWHPDSIYTVDLIATKRVWWMGSQGTIGYRVPIEVKKPARLLTPGQSPTYRLSRDVFDNEINIDDTCIVYGGQYGIPPQFLKGQMLKEAGRIDLAGGEKGFAPSYRYEPFTMQLSKAWETDSRYNGGLWVVDSNRAGHEMGTGKDIPMHQNVQDMPYPRSPKTVWDILYDNSELVNTGSSKEHRVYGKRLPNGKMVFPSQYEEINEKYNEFLNANKKYNDFLNVNGALASLFSSKSKEEIAREKMIEYLRDKWKGGAKKMVAQTRLASSYGLLQVMYSTAVEQRGYPSRNPNISPEDFNVTTTNMTYSLEYMKQLLQRGLTLSVEESGNWPDGFEHWFIDYVWPIWNTGRAFPGGTYARGAYSNTKKFLPQDK